MDHYNKGDGLHNPWLDEDMQPLALTESEIDDDVAFLASLTSSQYQQQGAKEPERQRALSRTNRPQRDTARAFARNRFGPNHPLIVRLRKRSQQRNDPPRCSPRPTLAPSHFVFHELKCLSATVCPLRISM
jgi:hypothetical protein